MNYIGSKYEDYIYFLRLCVSTEEVLLAVSFIIEAPLLTLAVFAISKFPEEKTEHCTFFTQPFTFLSPVSVAIIDFPLILLT